MKKDNYKQVNYNPEKLERLRTAYSQAVSEKKDDFNFEDGVLVTGYAKYLIQYLDSVFYNKSL